MLDELIKGRFTHLEVKRLEAMIVSYAKVVHAAIWGETEVNWRHQAAVFYRMASKQCSTNVE